MREKLLGFILIITFITFPNQSNAEFISNPKVSINLFEKLELSTVKISSVPGEELLIIPEGMESFSVKSERKITINTTKDGIEVKVPDFQTCSTGSVIFRSEEANLIMINGGALNERFYSGDLTVSRGKNGLRLILSTAVENFINQILISEFSDIDNTHAVKAFSIVSRTFTFFNIGRHKENGFDFCDLTHCQVFKGWNTTKVSEINDLKSKINKALSGTRGLVLSYDGRLIEGYYTACCGGYTATPEMIWGGESIYPFRQTHSPFCKNSRYYRWEKEMDINRFIKIFGLKKESLKVSTSKPSEKGGYINKIYLSDADQSLMLDVSEFRRKVAEEFGWNTVLSHAFKIELKNNRIIVTGRGFGHGIGLCQHCIENMGRLGYNWKNIIDFFYPGAKTVKIDYLKR